MNGNRKNLAFVILFLCVFVLNGCAVVFQKGRRSDSERIRSLEDELNELRFARDSLEKRLAREIDDKQVKVSMADKGLVITFVAEVLFDSGKAKLRKESLPILDKVAGVLKSEVPQNDIGIEGHTDNQPIKYSPWKSNWELSAHRALSVLEYLQKRGIAPDKLSATGFGEYKPVAANDSAANRQLNRRVEIVIVPRARKAQRSTSSGIFEEELK